MYNDNGMKIGLRLPQTDEHRATKQNIIRLATEAENAGFDSLWVLERLIWPIKPHDPYPGSTDGKLPFLRLRLNVLCHFFLIFLAFLY
jgi:alkanesulfonate monooxygenase SsuD/methylene tetrahydromethanopterin reductase-like flavin-dependent oxidoreductase (luciferase family)